MKGFGGGGGSYLVVILERSGVLYVAQLVLGTYILNTYPNHNRTSLYRSPTFIAFRKLELEGLGIAIARVIALRRGGQLGLLEDSKRPGICITKARAPGPF